MGAFDSCPNCQSPRKEGEESCPSCGFLYTKWQSGSVSASKEGEPAHAAPAPLRRKPKKESGHLDTVILVLLLITAVATWHSQRDTGEDDEGPVRVGAGRAEARPTASKPAAGSGLWQEPSGLPKDARKEIDDAWDDGNPKVVLYFVDRNVGSGKVREVRYHENGRMSRDTHYNGEVRSGGYYEWYENGGPKVESTFASDKRQGRHITWYEGGRKECEGNLARGEGELTCWEEDSRESYKESFTEPD